MQKFSPAEFSGKEFGFAIREFPPRERRLAAEAGGGSAAISLELARAFLLSLHTDARAPVIEVPAQLFLLKKERRERDTIDTYW